MRRTKVVTAKAIHEAGAWLVPSLEKGESTDTFTLEIRNGTTWATDFLIDSHLVTRDFNFYLDNKSVKNWEVTFSQVKCKRSRECLVQPASQGNVLEIHIPKFHYKLLIDSRWRKNSTIHKFRL